ncbi:MAG: phage baseplate assembly protein V [Desulfovibrio sp.]|nr:phage baseplate assembly protein V [Desulfovibrio sp.]
MSSIIGDVTTGWLPFAALRAGQDRTWHTPEPGEHVVVVCPCGDTKQGVVVGSVYRDPHPAP